MAQLEAAFRAFGVEPPPPSAAVPPATPSAPSSAPFLVPPPPPPPKPLPPLVLPPETPTHDAPTGAERFIGTKVTSIAGGIAVLSAIGLFLHHAIERGWLGNLGPIVPFAIGVAASLTMLAVSEFAARRWNRGTSIGLAGAGIGGLYASAAAGIFSLQVLTPFEGTLMALGITVVGGVLAARTGSLVVATLTLVGAYLVPAACDVLDSPGMGGGVFLSVLLLLSLVLVSAGPPHMAVLRFAVMAASVPLGAYWAIESGSPRTVVAAFVVGCWGLVTLSCIVESLRGRAGTLAKWALIVASVLASLACLDALGGATRWTEAAAYIPLAVSIGLAVIAAQFSGNAADAVEAGGSSSERADEATQLSLQALGGLCRGALISIPVTLAAAAAILLPAEWMAPLAGVAMAALALAYGRLGGAPAAVPGMVAWSLVFIAASIAAMADRSPAWQWAWVIEHDTLFNGLLFRLHFTSSQAGAFVGAAAAAAALSRRGAHAGLAHSAALVAALVAAPALALSFGLVPGLAFASAVNLAIGARGAQLLRWLPSTLLLTWALLVVWVGAYFALIVERQPSTWAMGAGYWMLGTLPVALASMAYAGRHLPPFPRRALWCGCAAAGGVLVPALLIAQWTVDYGHRDDALAIGVTSVSLASAAVLAWGAMVRERSLAIIAMVLLGAAGLIVFFLGIWVALGRGFVVPYGDQPLWGLTLLLPVTVGFAVQRFLARMAAAEATRTVSHSLDGFLSGAVVLSVLAAAQAMLGNALPEVAVPVVLLVACVGNIALGFRLQRSGLRWCGLALVGLLCARLLVVELAGAPALLRIGALLVSGLVMAGIGILYARLDGRERAARRAPPVA